MGAGLCERLVGRLCERLRGREEEVCEHIVNPSFWLLELQSVSGEVV